MKFLKKDASEGTFVAETVLHAALSHPEISFRFTRDGKQQYVTPGDGDLRSAVYAVLGREFARDLLAVEGGSDLYHVTGLITPPRACRASRGAQHFFVNGRYVKNRTMMAALENAYKGHDDAGEVPRRGAYVGAAARYGGCQRSPGQDRDTLCQRKVTSLTLSTALCARRWPPLAAVSAGLKWAIPHPARARRRRKQSL